MRVKGIGALVAAVRREKAVNAAKAMIHDHFPTAFAPALEKKSTLWYLHAESEQKMRNTPNRHISLHAAVHNIEKGAILQSPPSFDIHSPWYNQKL